MKYSKEEILKAAEIGEVSMVDAIHICNWLREAKEELQAEKRKTLFDDVERVKLFDEIEKSLR